MGACAVLAGMLATGGRAVALPGDLATRFPVNDGDPVASIPTLEQRNRDPLEFGYFVQDLIARAENAFVEKDWAGSVKYYEALARTAPDRAFAFSRLCSGYRELGKIDIAAANCGKALGLSGAVAADHLRFVQLSLLRPALTPAEIADLDASLSHLRAHAQRREPEAPAAEPSQSPVPKASAPAASSAPDKRTAEQIKRDVFEKLSAKVALATEENKRKERLEKERAEYIDVPLETEVLACKLGIRLRDAKRLTDCVARLQGLKVDAKLLLPFEWSRALVAGDFDGASALLERARLLGFPEPSLRSMRAEQEKARTAAPARRWPLFALGLVIPLLSLLLLVKRKRAQSAPSAAEPAGESA